MKAGKRLSSIGGNACICSQGLGVKLFLILISILQEQLDYESGSS